MSYMNRQLLITLAVAALIGLLTWLWFSGREKQWEVERHVSEAAVRDDMLAPRRWLELYQHPVSKSPTLHEALLSPLPPGVLLIADSTGIVTPEQAAKILTWVRAGNTLIMRPHQKHGSDDDEGSDQSGSDDSDPLGSHVGLELVPGSVAPKDGSAKDKPATTTVLLPGARHALHLDKHFLILQATGKGPEPVFADSSKLALQAFAEGPGYIVVLAGDLFDNDHLGRNDHAELLLALTQLKSKTAHVTLVRYLDTPRWYITVLRLFPEAVAALILALFLLLWVAARRFGPVLPEPGGERRALIEHIDASGRWLWKVRGGQDILLTAARAPIFDLLRRRVPALMRLAPAELCQRLADECGLTQNQVSNALHDPAKKIPGEFTRQIQLLQGLRKHYER